MWLWLTFWIERARDDSGELCTAPVCFSLVDGETAVDGNAGCLHLRVGRGWFAFGAEVKVKAADELPDTLPSEVLAEVEEEMMDWLGRNRLLRHAKTFARVAGTYDSN